MIQSYINQKQLKKLVITVIVFIVIFLLIINQSQIEQPLQSRNLQSICRRSAVTNSCGGRGGSNNSTSTTSSSLNIDSQIKMIIGIVFGIVGFILVLSIIFYLVYRCKRNEINILTSLYLKIQTDQKDKRIISKKQTKMDFIRQNITFESTIIRYPPRNLICSICLKNQCQLTLCCCESHFYLKCLDYILRNAPSCPICNASDVFQNPFKKIYSIYYFCAYCKKQVLQFKSLSYLIIYCNSQQYKTRSQRDCRQEIRNANNNDFQKKQWMKVQSEQIIVNHKQSKEYGQNI